jgi:hypothetical protein
MDKVNDQELEQQMRQMTVGQVLDLFDRLKIVSEERWGFRRKVLSLILNYARGFYDDHDCYDYDFALTIAKGVLDGSSPEHVLHNTAGLAYYILKLDDDVVSEVRDLTADERARFERIRDTHPEFSEEPNEQTRRGVEG